MPSVPLPAAKSPTPSNRVRSPCPDAHMKGCSAIQMPTIYINIGKAQESSIEAMTLRKDNIERYSEHIVAVHGLNGDAQKTWASDDGKICWLKDLLPTYLETAAIVSWGYNANVSTLQGRAKSQQQIAGHAQTLVSQLHAYRTLEGFNDCPIIFLCHSLGGIVVKRALTYSATQTSWNVKHLHQIFLKSVGILFFGTPHRGSPKAKTFGGIQGVVSRTVPEKVLGVRSHLVRILHENSPVLSEISDQFAPFMNKFMIFNFWEMKKSNLLYTRNYIVEESSAAPIRDGNERAGIMADHRGMCRFKDHDSPGFQMVVEALERYSRIATQNTQVDIHEAALSTVGEITLDQAIKSANVVQITVEDGWSKRESPPPYPGLPSSRRDRPPSHVVQEHSGRGVASLAAVIVAFLLNALIVRFAISYR